ncbi:MAG: hypothetical protein K9N46_08630 [Candidatus Marinimicrobia bacterium]|nr:hypothetical protein [Candidatus Neomarinimicrobiota bacterium]MCF7828872.1 hypothetical protein [Candidatus Neomarinimicrobiota bacterium]MCF7880790.1 hypothetical protein [Candidatus Neomarinimicrobiota bacterium]
MIRKILSVRTLRILTVLLGMYAMTSFGTPQPVEAEYCRFGLCGYFGHRINGGCFDSENIYCVTVYLPVD